MVAPAALAPSDPLPAGADAEDVAPARPSFRDRGRLRRRLRYLRRVRELGFRDLGGLVFDLHRFGRQGDDLVRGKLAALEAVDRELRAIERVLDDRRDIIELREPGIAACPRCGALHGSEARFCPSCGTQLSGPLAIGEVGEGPLPGADVRPLHAAGPTQPAPTPVTAALANPAPVAVPPPAAGPAGEATAAGAATPGGQASAPSGPPAAEHPAPDTATRVEPAVDQPTQAMPAVPEPGNGDPLPHRDRTET